MQFSYQKSFGYPVLREGSDDYINGAFQPTVVPQNVRAGDNEVIVKCRFSLSVPEIQDLIDKKLAAFALIIDCRDTFFREIYYSNENKAEFKCDKEVLKGRVVFESYIVARKAIDDFRSEFINPFFGSGPHKFSIGMVFAQGVPLEKNIHAEKLRDSKSLISFNTDESLRTGEWWFDVLSEFPSVYVSPEQLSSIKSAPSNADPMIENTFLVPIVAEMISSMRDEELEEQVEAYPWSALIHQGLEEAGHSVFDSSLNAFRLAQIYLGLPLSRQNLLFSGGQ
ncbi:MAG: hypothetical protein CMM80_05275 [Rhodospirillaceae bacterium]|nr:hypothetical protein [Rhodospirillaceae bacterium]